MSPLLLTLAVGLAHGAPTPAEEAALVAAAEAEMARAASLSLPDSEAPYHLRYKLLLLDQVSVHASFGGLVRRFTGPSAALGVEMRVGEPGWDNTGFGGWQDGFTLTQLGAEPTPHSLRLDAWRVTDAAYKQAVEQRSRKLAQASRPDDHPGDHQMLPPTVFDGGRGEPADAEPLVDRALALSAVFAEAPSLEVGEVFLGHEAGAHWILDTDGGRVRRPLLETSLRAVATLRTPDGALLADDRLWTVRDPADLPDVDAQVAEVVALRDGLLALADAPILDEEYVGPVVFEDRAVADLFRYLLLPQLEGTPPPIPFDTFVGDLGEQASGARLQRRVLPSGWTTRDDPAAHPTWAGSYTHDDEGTPAEAVELVDDGIVVDLLMSRVPRKDLDGTNGHGRSTLSDRAQGKPAVTFVRPGRADPERRLWKKAFKLASAYGRDHVVVVRRLTHPALRGYGDPDAMFQDVATVPPPVALVRRYADGREEVLRGAAFAAVERWVLREIAAASGEARHAYLAAWDGDTSNLGPTEGRPSTLVVPEAVLLQELELLPMAGDPSAVHVLPPPSR